MTKLEEHLLIYADQLETIICSLTNVDNANSLIKRAQESSDRFCINEKTKELIDQCDQN